MIELIDISRNRQLIKKAYQFLTPHFGPEELESLDYYMQLSLPHELPKNIWIAGIPATNKDSPASSEGELPTIVSAAILDLIPVYDRDHQMIPSRTIGAIGHALVDTSLRGLGIGRALNKKCEDVLLDYAQHHNVTLEAFVLESELDACFFWCRVGYRWPEGSVFQQPPLGYTTEGKPSLPAIPMFFMIKHPDYTESIPGQLAQTYLFSLLLHWYRTEIPSLISEPIAISHAYNYFDKHYLAPALNSLASVEIKLCDLRKSKQQDLASLLDSGERKA